MDFVLGYLADTSRNDKMSDKQIELLNDMRTEEGNYKLGNTIYDREGNVIDEIFPRPEDLFKVLDVDKINSELQMVSEEECRKCGQKGEGGLCRWCATGVR